MCNGYHEAEADSRTLEWEGEPFDFCAAAYREQFVQEQALALDTLMGYSEQGARR
jgi:hypothetical protein